MPAVDSGGGVLCIPRLDTVVPIVLTSRTAPAFRRKFLSRLFELPRKKRRVALERVLVQAGQTTSAVCDKGKKAFFTFPHTYRSTGDQSTYSIAHWKISRGTGRVNGCTHIFRPTQRIRESMEFCESRADRVAEPVCYLMYTFIIAVPGDRDVVSAKQSPNGHGPLRK